MSEPALKKDRQVIVTHVDDSTRGRKVPCVYLWGKYVDNNTWIPMDECIENMRKILQHRAPPLHQNLQVGQICCVLINQQWHRARVKQHELDPDQKLKVQLVDSGASYCVPLASLRTLEDISGKMAEHIRERQPIAFKFVLADIVAPTELMDTNCQWSEKAISFLKSDVLNHNWTAIFLGTYKECQTLRLFYPLEHHLLATTMIRQGFGIPTQTYRALLSAQWIDDTPSSQRAAHNPTSLLCNMQNVNSSLALPPADDGHELAPVPTANRQLFKEYVTHKLPQMGRHEVVVSHVAEGPFKFYVLLKSAAPQLADLRQKLKVIFPRKFTGVLQLHSPCLAFSQTDKLYHRGQITSTDAGDVGDQRSVYFVDMGTKNLVDLDSIYDIPDELMLAPIPQPVSLNRVEEVSELSGLQEIFTTLVNPSNFLLCEVVGSSANQKVNLYDQSGKSLLDLLSVHSNLLTNSQTAEDIADVAQEVIRAPRRRLEPSRKEGAEDPTRVEEKKPATFSRSNQQLEESIQTNTLGCIEQKPPVDRPIQVIISDFTRNFNFYIRYCCHEVELNEMMKDIQMMGPQAERVDASKLKKRNIYLLKNHDDFWYRVRIMYVGRFGVICRSLDYGTIFSVPINNQIDFRIIKRSLRLIPSFAICVALADVDSIKHKIAREEKQNLVNKKYLMDIVREGSLKLVKLKSFNGEGLAEKLSESGLSDSRSRR